MVYHGRTSLTMWSLVLRADSIVQKRCVASSTLHAISSITTEIESYHWWWYSCNMNNQTATIQIGLQFDPQFPVPDHVHVFAATAAKTFAAHLLKCVMILWRNNLKRKCFHPLSERWVQQLSHFSGIKSDTQELHGLMGDRLPLVYWAKALLNTGFVHSRPLATPPSLSQAYSTVVAVVFHWSEV